MTLTLVFFLLTSYPFFLSIKAATVLSTPPETPTATRRKRKKEVADILTHANHVEVIDEAVIVGK